MVKSRFLFKKVKHSIFKGKKRKKKKKREILKKYMLY